jgi:hypothetical protein
MSTIFAPACVGHRDRYSGFVYDSRLDELNVAHLEGKNALYVFLEVRPIDARLPALGDAGG